jgi:multiple sugar transport system ATP-binding protein
LDPAHAITARVEVVEPMGAEVFVYLHTGTHAFTARLDAYCPARVDQDFTLVLNLQKAHFFDAETGHTVV